MRKTDEVQKKKKVVLKKKKIIPKKKALNVKRVKKLIKQEVNVKKTNVFCSLTVIVGFLLLSMDAVAQEKTTLNISPYNLTKSSIHRLQINYEIKGKNSNGDKLKITCTKPNNTKQKQNNPKPNANTDSFKKTEVKKDHITLYHGNMDKDKPIKRKITVNRDNTNISHYTWFRNQGIIGNSITVSSAVNGERLKAYSCRISVDSRFNNIKINNFKVISPTNWVGDIDSDGSLLLWSNDVKNDLIRGQLVIVHIYVEGKKSKKIKVKRFQWYHRGAYNSTTKKFKAYYKKEGAVPMYCFNNTSQPKQGILKKKKDQEKVRLAWNSSTGTKRIAVVGTVRDEKVMMTSRGGSITGTVKVETENGEELIEAVPNKDGHFTIDFRDIATGVIATKLIITALDTDGNPQTRSTVDYKPGIPSEMKDIPKVTTPDIPYIENHQLVKLQGENFGEGTEVIFTDDNGEAVSQEVLSSSTNELIYFLDAPVGASEVSVRNEYGNSEPLEINVYEFNVSAGKMNLIKKEKTNITAVYEGLPEGTKIIFTNMSNNVTVKPNGIAKTSGNDIIFIVKESAGEVSMTIKALQAGGWELSYRLEFPGSD